MWSLHALRANLSRTSCASFLRSARMGSTKGSRYDIAHAMVSTGSRHLNSTATRIILPRRGGTGSSPSSSPSGVSVSVSSSTSAPISRSTPSAVSIDLGSGGSMALDKKVCTALPPAPISAVVSARQPERSSCLICRHSSSSGVRSISATWKSAIAAWRSLEKRWMLRPGRTRPARPARCLADARDVHVACRLEHCVKGSYSICLTLPASMTKTMSSMVIDVSAMLVAMTILRTPGGGRSNTARCSDVDSVECSG
mmetsp:Transcript_17145/g.60172  ORF Transcript_17145/g.60172 Transcript_17145/m.60172 type:complete len:255 (+) Transcript_17145:800-1564(+)